MANFLAPDPLQSTFFIPGSNTPGNGVQLFIYLAGSTTKTTVYKTQAGTAHTNPIILDSGGNLPSQSQIWIPAGVTIKAVYAPSNDTDPPASPYLTLDNLSGINDVAATASQWIAGPTPTFIGGTIFSLVGDQTADFQVGRRVEAQVTAGTAYATITSSAFTSTTIIGLRTDSIPLDSGLSAVSYGLLSSINPSVPLISDQYPIRSAQLSPTKQYGVQLAALTTSTIRNHYIVDEDAASGQDWGILNGTLVASVSSNALTVAVKTKNVTDPSATDPVFVKFPSASSGAYTIRQITGALSLVVPNGATLGTSTTIASRLYVPLMDNAGSVIMGIYNPYDGVSLKRLNEAAPVNSTSMTTGSDVAQTIYANSAASGMPFRYFGYIETSQTTSGVWALAPSKVYTLKSGDVTTGDIIQRKRGTLTASATGTTTINLDDTIPQSNEGDPYAFSTTIVPTSAFNFLQVETKTGCVNNNAGTSVRVLSMFRDSATDAFAVDAQSGGQNFLTNLYIKSDLLPAASTTPTTFVPRIGAQVAGTNTINGSGGSRLFGGVYVSWTEAVEIFQ